MSRIGYIISQYPAASHTFIRREIEALRRQGVQIDTFSIRRPAAEECASLGDRAAFEQTYYVLPVRPLELARAHLGAIVFNPASYGRVLGLALRHRAPGARALLWALFHFAESIVLARVLRQRGIEHLHNHFANAGANVGFLTAKFLGVPWSLTLHGISEIDYPAGLLLGEKIAAAHTVACASHFMRAQAMRLSSDDHWHKLTVVRCGLDLSAMPSRCSGRGETGSERRIVCVGRLSAEKGHLGLLQAFDGLRGRGIEAQLILVGDGPERARIERLSATLGLQHHLVLKGRLGETDTLQEIARSDLLVLPSFLEGLPIVLMEAMALGVPAVAARVAGIPELIEDGDEGLLFRPADWTDLEGKMALLLSDEDLRGRISNAARAKVASEFEIEQAVGPLAALFTEPRGRRGSVRADAHDQARGHFTA